MEKIFNDKQNGELNKPLHKDNINTRSQGGVQVSYLQGWYVISEANRIFGFDGWTRETVYCNEISRVETVIGTYKKAGWKIGYEAKVRIRVGDIIREGTGHGSGTMTDLFDAIESASKEAETDAMKRALMTFGNQFGLALYDKQRRNVTDTTDHPIPVVDASIQSPKGAELTDKGGTQPIVQVSIPTVLDGSGSDWFAYSSAILEGYDRCKTKNDFFAFRDANSAGLTAMQKKQPELREKVSAYARSKLKANGWLKQKTPDNLPIGGENVA